MAKGRDTWDYLAYYLQLTDRHPPFSDLQVFRTPLTPILLGVPLSARRHDAPRGRLRGAVRGGDRGLERDGADLRAHPGALHGRPAARLSGVRDAVPPGLERRDLRDGARPVGAPACPDAQDADRLALRRARRRDGGPRAHPPRERDPAAARARPAPRPRRLGPPASRGPAPASRAPSCCSAPGPCTTTSATTISRSRAAGAPGCRS